jgi:NAD(P)H-flavin reductase
MLVETPLQTSPMLPRRYVVTAVQRETADIVTWSAEPLPEDGPPPGPFEPGQFNMVYAFGVGEVPISISSDPADPVVRHTIRAVGPVTTALCDLAPGAMVGIRGPYGQGWGVGSLDGHDVVFVAGGIGLAPLRPAIYRVLAERPRYGTVLLLLGARTPSDLCFASELDEWRGQGMDVEVSVDYAEPGWTGHVGVVTTLLPRAPFTPSEAAALVCGPEVMMRYAAKGLVARGVDPALVRVSLERNMECGLGQCGHCQLGGVFVCKDGPVLPWPDVAPLMEVWER